jgi:hypothetical protein
MVTAANFLSIAVMNYVNSTVVYGHCRTQKLRVDEFEIDATEAFREGGWRRLNVAASLGNAWPSY